MFAISELLFNSAKGSAKGIRSIFEASMYFEYSLYRRRIRNAISPKIELSQGGLTKTVAGFFVEGSKAFGKRALQVFDFPLNLFFKLSFDPAFLYAYLNRFPILFQYHFSLETLIRYSIILCYEETRTCYFPSRNG
uniref:Uncharacterized protein n=1 Tax=Candidatus Kentrum sp. DK TaxID=2126562 RepID=A0A450SX52_9GAMM|nr:MAG: hypothetical protein BECKDK2373C_GA0170839_106616 [Candidatus Kentron sp. DK]